MNEEKRTLSIKTYYGSLANMKKKYDRYARKDGLQATDKKTYEAWKKEARQTLSLLLGLDKMDKVPLNPIVEETVTLDNGIIREKIRIQTEEDVWMPIYILIPQGETKEKRKVFLAPPGHQGGGKYSIAGCDDIPAIADAIKRFNYDYGMQLAKMGYVAVCPDCRGFGERRDEYAQKDAEESFLRSSCYNLSHMAEAIGETVVGMCTWDLMRLLDYVETRTEWDTEHIACLGFSGGGMQTLYVSALDDRIKAVCISGYFYGFKDSLLILNNNCNCNYVPHLWEHFDMGDIGALIAPRPVMIQSCKEDHLNGPRGLENVYEQMDILKAAYRVYDAENRIVHDIEEGGHKWHGDHVEEVFQTFFEQIENEE